MLIAEQLMLLCIDPRRGDFEHSRLHADMNMLAAGAVILDLFEQRRLHYRAGHIVIESLLPTTHPQLAAAAGVLSGPMNGLALGAAIELLVVRLNPVSRLLLESLFRRDVLHRVRESWWPWSRLRFPLRSIQARNEAKAQLHKAATTDEISPRELGLLVLTDLAGQLAASLSGDAHEAAAQKLMHLSAQTMDDPAAHDLIVDLRASLTG